MKKHVQIKNMMLDIYVIVYDTAMSKIGVKSRSSLVKGLWQPLDQDIELNMKYRTKELY